MGEKRKPVCSILLRFHGNRKGNKLEFFQHTEFGHEKRMHHLYRLRIDGKWWPEGDKKFFNMTQIKHLVFKSINDRINRGQ